MADTKKDQSETPKDHHRQLKRITSDGKCIFGFPDQAGDIIKSIQTKADNYWLLYQIFDAIPYPIQIFTPDGTAIYLNKAHLDLNNIQDPALVIGKYNMLKDPAYLDKQSYRKQFKRAFRGETIIIKNFPAPIQDLVKRKVIEEEPYGSAWIDGYFYSVWKGDSIFCVVCVMMVLNDAWGQ